MKHLTYTYDMKFISWNVNGIRAWKDKKETLAFLESEFPDFICFQETKIDSDTLNSLAQSLNNETLFRQYPFQYWNSATKKGYSGTAILTRHEPIKVTHGIAHPLDDEGRVITLEYENFFVITVYTPNSKDDLSRLDTRYDSWDPKFLSYIRQCKKNKPVIVCGDFNVAHQVIDIAHPNTNKTTATKPGSAGFTDREREGFSNYIESNFIDTFRYQHPERIQYSWWSYRGMARERNVGWRIDYFLVSENLKDMIANTAIFDQVKGSDHCPIGLEVIIT